MYTDRSEHFQSPRPRCCPRHGSGRRIEHHATLSSTQDRAHELAGSLARCDLPLVIVADAQTAGRGRGTNRWWTGSGSLAMSLLFDPSAWDLERSASPQRSLCAALAVVDAVRPLLPAVELGIHWPNDVFAAGCSWPAS